MSRLNVNSKFRGKWKGHWVDVVVRLLSVAFPGDFCKTSREIEMCCKKKGEHRGSVFNWVISLLFYKKTASKRKKHLRHELHRILEKYQHYLVNEISDCMIGSSLQCPTAWFYMQPQQQVKVLFSLQIIRCIYWSDWLTNQTTTPTVRILEAVIKVAEK